MARRWRDPSAFRADPAAAPALRPSRTQSLALLVVLVLIAGAVTLASYLVRPDKARAFDLLHGSLFIDYFRGPVAIDLASAKPTVRINFANDTVNAQTATQLTVVPLESGTLLLNTATGEFNMIDRTGFVVKHDGGVPLPQRTGRSTAVGIASGDLAYIEQTGTSGTSVYLVTPSTVTSAVSAGSVKPRGFISMDDPGSAAAGAATTADGSLWLLLGRGARRTVRQLSVPPNSSTGATLRSTDHGTVTGPAALASATTGTGAIGTVGLATPGRIELFTGTARHRVRFTAPDRVDRILPTSDQDGRLSYLMHGTDGWSVVSVNADGSGLRRPTALAGIPGAATLVEPAQSRGALYTVDSSSGAIYRVDTSGAASKLADYPLARQDGSIFELADYTGVYVVARESRVIVNAPPRGEALAIFTDGSRGPLRIQKGAGVSVSAAGGAEELAQAHTQKQKPNSTESPTVPPRNNSTPPPPPPPATNQLPCSKTGQQPHIPRIIGVRAAARSVRLAWIYPIIDRDDCVARTYLISVTLASSGAPTPPEPPPVQDQTSFNVTGLFPSTQYYITVTAKIGNQGATSPRQLVTTGPAGPDAPTDVTVVADADGNWDLSWSSCGTIEQGCVPPASWDILPTYCDGVGVEGQLTKKNILADGTTTQQGPVQYPGGGALLGRGLSFQIEGIGMDQSTGTSSASTPCVTSWSPPVLSALTLSASRPPPTSLGGTAATTVSLDLGADATRDVGGLGAKITLTLTGPDGPQTKRITYGGDSTRVSATFGGVRAGGRYLAGATVTPPGPGGHSVTLSSEPVTTRADWPPALAIVAHCPRIGLGLTCDLTVDITGLTSADAHGERFDLTADSQLQCGTTTKQLSLTDFDPSQTPVTLDNLSQLNQLIGSCKVIIGLVENAGSPAPLIFGGTTSPMLTTSVDLGTPARANLNENDLDVAWGNTAIVKINAHDADAQNRIDTLTADWTEEVDAPDGTVCGTSSSSAPQDLGVASSCVDQHGGDSGPWTVTLTYADRSDGKGEGPLTYKLSGPVPGYQQCTPDTFTVLWGPTIADGVTATYQGSDPDVLAGCSKWQYTLLDPVGTSCGSASVPPPTDGTGVQLLLTCGTPPSPGWTVEVDYQDTAGDPQTIPVEVGGPPPTS